jgi:hypothetical protein
VSVPATDRQPSGPFDWSLNTRHSARRSGHSIFSRPKPIDLRSGRANLDIDIEDGDDENELGRPLISDGVLFDATDRNPTSNAASPMPRAVQAQEVRDAEDVWAELG